MVTAALTIGRACTTLARYQNSVKPITTAVTSGNARSPWLYAMPTNDNEPSNPRRVAGWNPARRNPSNSSNAAAATITVTSTAVPARPMTNASSATAARIAPVTMRVGRSSRVRSDAG